MDKMDTEKAVNMLQEKISSWLEGLVEMIPNLLVAILIVVLFYLIARLIRYVVNKALMKTKLNVGLIDLTASTAYITVNIVGLFIALDVLELEKTVTSLLAGVGVAGLALGFAFQSTAANFVSGVFLAIRTPFKIGNIVQSGDVIGVVQKINLRSTTIRSFQGTDVIIPNKDVLQSPIFNYHRSGKRRIDLSCGVSYGDDLQKVKKLSEEAIQDIKTIDKEAGIKLFYQEFGNSSINFILTAWTKEIEQEDFLTTQSEMIMKLKACYDENDITIPFPIRTLDFGIKGGERLKDVLKNEEK